MVHSIHHITALRISWAVKKFDLLPRSHYGGRKGLSAQHALHIVLERVQTAWRSNQAASLLLLDVTGAFDYASHKRLLHNLRKRRIGGVINNSIQSFQNNHQPARIRNTSRRSNHGDNPGVTFITHPLHLLQCRPTGAPLDLS